MEGREAARKRSGLGLIPFSEGPGCRHPAKAVGNDVEERLLNQVDDHLPGIGLGIFDGTADIRFGRYPIVGRVLQDFCDAADDALVQFLKQGLLAFLCGIVAFGVLGERLDVAVDALVLDVEFGEKRDTAFGDIIY